MKGAQVRMYQPYALVVEASRTVNGHLVKVQYDDEVFTQDDAKRIAAEVQGILEQMVQDGEGVDIEELIE